MKNPIQLCLRNVSLFLLLICFPFLVHGQAKNAEEITYTPGGYLDHVFDDKGNKYSLGQIAIDNKIRAIAAGDDVPVSPIVASTCSSGYFQLYLETGCGMEGTDAASVARLNVLCRVLYDISQFINSPCSTTGQKVNIWVRNSSGIGVPGTTTPFYNVPYSPTASGIADNTAWITINSGTDAFKNVTTPLTTSGGGSSGATYFHGSIRFDFSSAVAWHTNLATAPAAGEFDLYTCAMHEMLHMLGFGTLMDYDGQSVIGPTWQYYTRYDQHLRTSGGVPLLTTSSTCTQKYQNVFNSSLTPGVVLSPGGWTGGCALGYSGSLTDNTPCSTAVQYVGSTTVKVYTPSCFERGSSLSHFEDQCYTPPSWFTSAFSLSGYNNHYFSMSNSGALGPYGTSNPAAMKRYPKPEERLALCDMGYSVNTTYGDVANLNYYNYGGTVCPGTGVAGINDGISATGTFLYSTMGSVVLIPLSGLLSNDYGTVGGSVSCLEVIDGTGTITMISGWISYTRGAGDHGVKLLRYIPVSASGVEGNITYVYMYLGSAIGTCVGSPCNLVLNGDFESASSGSSSLSNAHCWYQFNSADLFARGTTGYSSLPFTIGLVDSSRDVHPSSALPNDHVAGMVMAQTSPGNYSMESAATMLASPLIAGQTYEVSFWALISSTSVTHLGYLGYSDSPTIFQFAVSPDIPIVSMAHLITAPYPLTPLCDFRIPADNIWHYYTKTVTYTSATVANTLVLYMAPWLCVGYPSVFGHYIVFDDVSIKPASAVCSFALPDTMCFSSGLLDLVPLVSIPGGVFTWNRDSSGVAVPTSLAMFDPVLAYGASLLLRDTGYATVRYEYTDALGCKNSVYAQTRVLDTTASAILGVTTVIVGGTSALSDATPGGTWASANPSMASVDALTGMVTGVTAGTTTITYTLPSGCYVTVPFVVDFPGTLNVRPLTDKNAVLRIVPNPNNGSFTISGILSDNSKELEVEIIDVLGRQVFHDKLQVIDKRVNKKVDLSGNAARGLYLLRTRTDQATQVMRFTVGW